MSGQAFLRPFIPRRRRRCGGDHPHFGRGVGALQIRVNAPLLPDRSRLKVQAATGGSLEPREAMIRTIPRGRINDVSEIANAAAYLVSDFAGFITARSWMPANGSEGYVRTLTGGRSASHFFEVGTGESPDVVACVSGSYNGFRVEG